jgi:hypothetical protein
MPRPWQHTDATAGKPGEDYLLACQADTGAFFGRHDRARELSRRAVESARDADASRWPRCGRRKPRYEAEIGEHERARAGAKAALSTFRDGM